MLRRPFSSTISKTPTSSHTMIRWVSQRLSLKRGPRQLNKAVSNRQLKRLCMALQMCSTVIGNLENGNKLITRQVKNLVRGQRPAKNRGKERLMEAPVTHKLKRIKLSRLRSIMKRNRHIINTTEKSILTKMDSRVHLI